MNRKQDRDNVEPDGLDATIEKGKKKRTPKALAHDALLKKSKLLARRSVEAKQNGQDADCQVWAAVALELLAKAQLAAIHPSLIVEAENSNSLLEANGINTRTVVRTIGAATAYARLRHTVPYFFTPVVEQCKKLSERRNVELHSGGTACAEMPYEEWEGDFLNAAELILSSMNMDFKEWLGLDAKTPKKLLEAYRQAEVNAAKQRVKHCAIEFKKSEKGKLRNANFALLVNETKEKPIDFSDFTYRYDNFWRDQCPSCKTFGAVGGDLAWEEIADDQSGAEYGDQFIKRNYLPLEFHCPTCGLFLAGDTALEAAGITRVQVEVDIESIAYEL